MSTWKADMEVRSRLKEWDMAQNRAQYSVLVPAMFQLWVTVTVLVTWFLRIYARSHAKSDSYLRHVCPSTFITTTAIKIG
jgi:carbon starvation protein CstA